MAFGGGRVGRKLGISLPKSLELEVGVPDRVGILSGDRFSNSKEDRADRSGDLSGDLEFSK